jgi:hypothetical protein
MIHAASVEQECRMRLPFLTASNRTETKDDSLVPAVAQATNELGMESGGNCNPAQESVH